MSVITSEIPRSIEAQVHPDGTDWVAELLDQPAQAPALITGSDVIGFGELALRVNQLADDLRAADVKVAATLMDNSAEWVVLDLALMKIGATHVPVAAYFTAAQQHHVLEAAAVDAFIMPAKLPGWTGVPMASRPGAAMRLILNQRPAGNRNRQRPAKVSFTSGSTGNPKGVCLDIGAMSAVARSVASSLASLQIRRHLSALPFAVLLENIAGLYGAMKAGAATVVLPSEQVGLRGSSNFDAKRLDDAVERYEAQSIIVLPQMLRAWAAERAGRLAPRLDTPAPGDRPQNRLSFVAVGGATVGRETIEFARGVGLPAYEGYGLTEGASVQTLNLPGNDRPGSAGRVLPHARIRCSADGEIQVSGNLFSGYLNEPNQSTDSWWPTGDLGEIDDDGFLWIRGRARNVLITGYGRNVSPEWVEAALQQSPSIAQAVVCGDGQPALCAIVWPMPGSDDAAVSQAVARANAALPDYARISHWVTARLPFDAQSGTATTNGRPRRETILKHHQSAIEAGYRSSR